LSKKFGFGCTHATCGTCYNGYFIIESVHEFLIFYDYKLNVYPFCHAFSLMKPMASYFKQGSKKNRVFRMTEISISFDYHHLDC
jgi:hypothetical protein